MKAFFWVWILPFVLLACHEARSAVLCNADDMAFIWRVGEPTPIKPRAVVATDPEAVCRVYDGEVQYIQKNFPNLHTMKHPGYEVIYTGSDALFIINNL